MDFAERLRVMRAWRGMSQERLAESSGVSRVYISYLESGRATPTANDEAALRAALGWDETVDAALEALAGEPAPAQA